VEFIELIFLSIDFTTQFSEGSPRRFTLTFWHLPNGLELYSFFIE
jgi:hypothetical protein